MARASGVPRDLRRDEPYLAYDDFDFDVVCASAGDCFSRFHVRMLEMNESVKIIKQALDKLPSGPIFAEGTGKEALPEKREVYTSIEGLIHHFENIMPNRLWSRPRTASTLPLNRPTANWAFISFPTVRSARTVPGHATLADLIHSRFRS